MSSDISRRLQAALGDRYRVDRELGRGGMTTGTFPLVGKWQQCHLSVSIDEGDDPRRPATEPSAAGVE